MTIALDANGYLQSDIDPATCDEAGELIIANWLKLSTDIGNLLTSVDELTVRLAGIDDGIDDNKMRAWYYR